MPGGCNCSQYELDILCTGTPQALLSIGEAVSTP